MSIYPKTTNTKLKDKKIYIKEQEEPPKLQRNAHIC